MATRKTKPSPWEVAGNPWGTEGKFIVWVRGVLRKGWSSYPLKINFKNSKRKRVKNTNEKSSKRFPEVWAIQCEICGKEFPQQMVEVDHIGEQGSFTSLADIKEYVEHLFMLTYEDMRCVCKSCHKIVSYSQRMGITFEQSEAIKRAIEYSKMPVAKQVALLKEKGYNSTMMSNAKKRRELFEKLCLRSEI